VIVRERPVENHSQAGEQGQQRPRAWVAAKRSEEQAQDRETQHARAQHRLSDGRENQSQQGEAKDEVQGGELAGIELPSVGRVALHARFLGSDELLKSDGFRLDLEDIGIKRRDKIADPLEARAGGPGPTNPCISTGCRTSTRMSRCASMSSKGERSSTSTSSAAS
jgi:hypothetical protein